MNIPQTIAAEQARYMHDHWLIGMVGSLVGAFIVAAVFYDTVAHTPLIAWLAVFAANTAYQFAFWRRFQRDRSGAEFSATLARRWFRLSTFNGAIAGAFWGIGALVLVPGANVAQQFTFLSGMMLMMVTTTFWLSPHYPTFLAFIFAMGLPTVFVYAIKTTEFHPALLVTCIFFMMSAGWRFNRLYREMLQRRFENVGLVKALEVEKDVAESANLAKSKFLAAASHDLRQPIHAQGLFLEVLARSELTTNQREVLASACAASEASAEMLNTLLDFSRIEAGVVEPQVRPFHLQTLLNKIENELAPQADAKGLIYRSRETFAAVQSDPALVEMILRNLVLNAIRYTEHGGVLVACRTRADVVLLEVWDTGIGIERSQQQEIFREFHQLGNAERDRRKGLGLGLAIVDGLARALGHGLSMSSTPQRGSVFRLALPITRVAVASDEFETVHSAAIVLDLRVLVIDDDEAVRAGMLQLLREWGCACEAAETIEEALALARVHPPELIISDYRLREQRTGAEAIAALRAEFGAELPALLITGDTAPERLREALASGVPLLHKPVSPTQLYRRLVSILNDAKIDSSARTDAAGVEAATPVIPDH